MQTFLNIASDRDRVVIAKRESSNSPARQQPANTISHDTKNKGTLFDDDSTPPQTTTTRDTSSTGMHQSPNDQHHAVRHHFHHQQPYQTTMTTRADYYRIKVDVQKRNKSLGKFILDTRDCETINDWVCKKFVDVPLLEGQEVRVTDEEGYEMLGGQGIHLMRDGQKVIVEITESGDGKEEDDDDDDDKGSVREREDAAREKKKKKTKEEREREIQQREKEETMKKQKREAALKKAKEEARERERARSLKKKREVEQKVEEMLKSEKKQKEMKKASQVAPKKAPVIKTANGRIDAPNSPKVFRPPARMNNFQCEAMTSNGTQCVFKSESHKKPYRCAKHWTRTWDVAADEGLVCERCKRGDNAQLLVLCDKCDKGLHIYCCTPKLMKVPEGDFFCSDCSPKPQKTQSPPRQPQKTQSPPRQPQNRKPELSKQQQGKEMIKEQQATFQRDTTNLAALEKLSNYISNNYRGKSLPLGWSAQVSDFKSTQKCKYISPEGYEYTSKWDVGLALGFGPPQKE